MGTNVWRCQSCFRVNTQEPSVCEKCGTPRYPDLDKADLSCSKVVYFFQAIFMLIAVIAVSGSKAGVVAFTLFILLVWWVGLGIFAAHPVGGEFRVERRLAKSFIESQGSNGAKLAARVAFFVLYWPIFISKDFYFWSILFVAGLYYALKHFYGK